MTGHVVKAHLVKAPAGVGKTTGVIKALASFQGRAEIYVPTHALAEELAATAQQHCPGKSVVAIGGRSHKGAGGKPLCRRYKVAQAVAALGGDVYSSLCEKAATKNKAGKAATPKRCKHYSGCAYINQFTQADIRIYPHAYLPLMRMKVEGPPPDKAVIDESFYQSCIDIHDLPLTDLRNPQLSKQVTHVLAEIEKALVHVVPMARQLASAGIGWSDVITAIRALKKSSGIEPQLTDRECMNRLAVFTSTDGVRKLLHAVLGEWFLLRDTPQRIVLDRQQQRIKVYTHQPIVRFHHRAGFGGGGQVSQVLLLDASADRTIASRWFSLGKVVHSPAPRSAYVVQCRSTRCSTTSLSPRRNADPKSKKAAKQRLKQLQQFIDRIAREHGAILVVGPQEFTGNPRTKVKGLLKCPPGSHFAHFNALRGIDLWKGLEAVIVIGRNQPPLEAVEGIARCVFAGDHSPLDLAEDWSSEPRGYRYRNGLEGVDVVVHPDPRVQAVLEQLRERESEQAIDRLRLIHCPSPKRVYILSNIPLDIDVDELVTWDQLMSGGLRLERAWARASGVLPLQPGWLAANHPDLWASKAAAKAGVRRDLDELQTPNGIYIRNLQLVRHAYRPTTPVGSRRVWRSWVPALSASPDAEATRQGLERVLGFPVELKGRAAPGPTISVAQKPTRRRPAFGRCTVRQLPPRSLPYAAASASQVI